MKTKHSSADIASAATLFFRMRGLVRSRLAKGRKLDPYAWLRIETLVYIRDHRGPSMQDIAEYLSITPPSATSLVASLAKLGLIVRQSNARDKRTVHLYLSKKGEKTLSAAMRHGRAVLGALFAALGPAEFRALTRALARVLKSSDGGRA